MEKGLLKAYLTDPIEFLSIPDRYSHRPDRHGLTIAFGEVSDDLLALNGTLIAIEFDRVIFGAQTAFCPVQIRSRWVLTPNPPHLTLGWVHGSAPVVAGIEGRRYLAGDLRDFPVVREIDRATKNLGSEPSPSRGTFKIYRRSPAIPMMSVLS